MARYPEALRSYEEALRIKKASLGAEHPDVAQTLNSIGMVYDVGDAPEPCLRTRVRSV
jgi:hypothetical protein